MKIKINNPIKSITEPLEFELDKFSILTGLNGRGKTHLLTALSNKAYSSIKINDKQIEKVLYVPFNGLNPNIPATSNKQNINQQARNAWNTINNGSHGIARFKHNATITNDQILNSISNITHKKIIETVLKESNKNIRELTETDFMEYYSFIEPEGNLFSSQFSHVFKNYHIKHTENMLNRFYIEHGHTDVGTPLSDQEFIEKYSTPPWDFINQVFRDTEIPYKVNNPMGTKIESDYVFKLIDINDKFEINLNDISTGEKVLMCLALAVYNTILNQSKPELLLLDEPDAPLHPSMSKKFLSIISKNIVQESNIPTIITTHSPTTIITANSASIYEISKEDKTPKLISQQRAIEILSTDLPFLRISNENRRQVFVESHYDVNYYEYLSNILARKESLPSEPIFIPARTSSGSNCTDVINVVKSLYQNGNNQIYGIIDWDLTNEPEDRLIVLGNKERYSIENYLLDPLKMGIFLLRETFLNFSDFEGLSISTYSEFNKLTPEDAQIIINKILKELELISDNLIPYNLYNGWELYTTKEFNEHQGHELESLYKTKYPKLNRYKREDGLKKDVIQKAFADYPGLIPNSIFDTIKKIT